MGRVRWVVALVVTLVGVWTATAMSPAMAQTPPTDSTTTTTTTTTAGETTSTTTPDPSVGGDAPPESVPDVPITVPPRESTDGIAPLPGRVVRVDLRGARASALARQAAYAEAVTRRTQLQVDLGGLQERVGKLAASARQAVIDLAAAKRDLTARAVDAYVRGNGFDTTPLLVDIASESDSQRAALLGIIVDRDRDAVSRVRELQSKVSADQLQTAKQLTETQSQLDQAKVDEAQAEVNLFDAKLDLAVSSVGGTLVIHGFVFPVADPHTFTEDFGDPRLPGTEFAHFHEGCDVVAAEGTELYAAERGVITQMSASLLGGTQLWLKGESGTSYYYAHLSRYAANLRTGQLVEAGGLVGYVGHTGDAYGPHLHFEVHPGGGSAIDPYPLLLVADQQP
ncbi:MAG: peptidoglycan LD-endopeptidase LytH [Acidimicrobiaceae bacterium]